MTIVYAMCHSGQSSVACSDNSICGLSLHYHRSNNSADSRGVQVEVPDQLKQDLTTNMKSAGIPVPDSEERWTLALEALKVQLTPHAHTRSMLMSCKLLASIWAAYEDRSSQYTA